MEPDTPKQPNKALIAIVVIALLAIITAAVLLLGKKDTPTTPSSESSPTTATTPPSTSSNSTSTYKDGTYKASGTYQSPGGTEKVNLTVTLAGGVITSTDLTADPSTRDAEDYQSRFIGGYKSLVVGKKIDEVSLSRVAGSSLTSGGFNQALDQIKSDAKA